MITHSLSICMHLQSLIRSDKENLREIRYSLTGPGVDEPPTGVFGVDSKTGFVKIFSILDREKIPRYTLKGVATYLDGSRAEKDIYLNITVVDENDCKPVIKTQQVGYVNESSAAGTVVMRVIATDADEEGSINSQIHYSIVQESNEGNMFFINSRTGDVIVQRNTLDRETKDTYKLMIKASDLNGQPGGNSGTGEIEINLKDINDNVPTLEKESYEGSVEENTVGVEVLRIKAVDMDLIHTENWQAVFKIISGNEGGYFTITTDAVTNEGIIMINKALDYEELKTLNLEVAVSNTAEYNFGSSSTTGVIPGKSYPVKINVVNQKEGPRFQPAVKVVTVSEDQTSVSINKVITNYAATDSDTLQTATNVWYAKGHDVDNWLIIDKETADIKLNKLPDRESVHLINGTYYAEIICFTKDVPSKSATGTIAIQVEDFNDHCPTLTSKTQTMCLEDNALFATAVDQDEFPNSSPFEFSVIEESSSKGKWTVEHVNATTAILRDQANLWPGTYKVALQIKDQQGKSCADLQIIDVTVCTCHKDTKACVSRSTSTVGLGAAGVLLLLLGLLLLLLVPCLLMFCLCGGTAAIGDFKALPFETKQQLISYHTEGQGEDKDIPLLHIPVDVDGGIMNATNINTFGGKGFGGGIVDVGAGVGTAFGGGMNTSTLTAENMQLYSHYKRQEEMGMMDGQEFGFSHYGGGAFDGMALSDHFLEEYYASQSQEKDAFFVYDFEGRGSLAGSVGCCSLLENDGDLNFLNDLGPKFKTLAEICQGSTLVTETVDAGVSIPPIRPASPLRPSTSTHTHLHTHSETIKDRDRVAVNATSMSNVASGSSTIITEKAQGSAAVSTVHLQDNIVIPSQTMLIQQPAMYYTATPMYVVESKPQVMLVAGATQQAVGQVSQYGLGSGFVPVGTLQGTQGMVLVDRQVGVGGAVGQGVQGVSQGAISKSSHSYVVENASSGRLQGAHVAQGFIQTGHGSAGPGLEVRSHGVHGESQGLSLGTHSSTESNENFTLSTTPKTKGSQRVVVQRKKVSVTERNVESSSRA
uniref:Desmoglein-2-like n=1 Tax=Gouania willdenowi TaxID=441366 RepID=A0A8C5GHF3_GOUWI